MCTAGRLVSLAVPLMQSKYHRHCTARPSLVIDFVLWILQILQSPGLESPCTTRELCLSSTLLLCLGMR